MTPSEQVKNNIEGVYQAIDKSTLEKKDEMKVVYENTLIKSQISLLESVIEELEKDIKRIEFDNNSGKTNSYRRAYLRALEDQITFLKEQIEIIKDENN